MPLTSTLSVLEKLLSNDSIPNIDKLIELQHLVGVLPYYVEPEKLVDRLPFEKYKDDKEISSMLRLAQIQLHLCFREKEFHHARIEEAFKCVHLDKRPQAGNSDLYLRIKYTDLRTDYQFLFAPTVTDVHFVELINKKLLLVNSVPETYAKSSLRWLTREVEFKVLFFVLLNGSDFRKKSILLYLMESNLFAASEAAGPDIELIYKKFHDHGSILKEYFDLTVAGKFIAYDKFEELLTFFSELPLLHQLITLKKDMLVENYLENNIALLPRFYESLYIDKIRTRFVDIGRDRTEDLLHRMIVSEKLPPGTAIDQLEGLVTFGTEADDAGYDKFNDHIKDVSELVSKIETVVEGPK